MKRKFVNAILMMALIVSSVSGFVACKDYDEDMYDDLRSRIDKETSLRDALQAQVDELTALVKSLENCKCDMSGYLTAEQANLDQYLTKLEAATKYMTEEELKAYVQSQMQGDYAANIASLEAAIAVMQSAIDGLNAKLAQVDLNTNEIAKQAGQISAMNSALIAVQETANKALELAQKAGTSFDPTDLISRLTKLETLMVGWDAKLTAVSTAAENAAAKAAANAALIAANKNTLDSLANVVKNIQGADIAINLTELQDRLKAIEEDYVKNGELDKVRADLEVAVQQAQLLAQLAMELATVNSGRIDEIDGCPDCVLSRIAALEEAFKNHLPDYSDLVRRVADLETKVGDLERRCTDCIERPEFDATIKKVNERIDSLAAVTKRIEDNLQYDILHMLTGIIVQAAESPVLGYLHSPFGVNATVLAVFYGQPTDAWDFPASSAKPYVNGQSDFDKLTIERNWEILGRPTTIPGYLKGDAGATIVTGNGEAGNAGTLYVTVNPANVNFAGETLKLVDSQDKVAPATLEPLVASDRTLNFGYTRAAANGFYEAKATIKAGDIDKAKMNVDYNALQEDIKDLLKDRTKSDVLELGSTLVNNITDILPAYGVMASWTDKSSDIEYSGTKGTEHKIYSQYNVAATAIKPLSLAFLNDWKGINSMPGLDRLQDLVGKIVNKINLDVNLNLPDFSKYQDVQIEFGNVEVPEMSDKIKVTFTLKLIGKDGDDNVVYIPVYNADGDMAMVTMNEDGTIGDLYINDVKTPWEGSGFSKDAVNNLISYEVEIDNDMKSTLEEVIASLKESGQSANDTLKDLLNDIAKIGDLDGTISGSIEDAKDGIKSTINSYISRINNKLTKWINRAPAMLHLTMVANAGDKIGILSQSKYMPTAASGAVTMVPTTYNLELLAPTYKKFVAVSDVFTTDGKEVDLAAAKSLAQAANGKNMGKVIEGNTTCTLNGQKGYIYEVTYMAVDYFGKVAINKYYVKF